MPLYESKKTPPAQLAQTEDPKPNPTSIPPSIRRTKNMKDEDTFFMKQKPKE